MNTDARAIDLRKRVTEFMNAPGGAPSVIYLYGATSEEVQEMVFALVCMVSCLMPRTVTDDFVCEIQCCIKIYLTLFHSFDTKLHPNKKSAKMGVKIQLLISAQLTKYNETI